MSFFDSKSLKLSFGLLYKLVFVVAIVIVIKMMYDANTRSAGSMGTTESFYNILPTELIDSEYHNINEDPLDYKKNLRVGDLYGVDLNCNNVNPKDLFMWIRNKNPHLLHQYVYLYDPSINIENPIDAPRVLKMLMRNLPMQHPFIPIIRKCFPYRVRIS